MIRISNVLVVVAFFIVTLAGAGGPEIYKVWSYPLATSITADDFVCISGDGDYIAAVSEYKKLYMFDAEGTMRWNYNIEMQGYYGSANVSSLSATDDFSRIYVAAENSPDLFVFDDTGDLVAKKPLEGEPLCCCVAGDGSKLFVGFDDGRLECYKTGGDLELLWTFFEPVEARPGETLPWRANAISLIDASDDGSVVVALIGKRQLVILDADGAVQYKFPAAGDVTTVAVNGAGNVITAAYMVPDTASGELISLPTKPERGKAVKPLRRYRFERYVSSVDMTDDGKLVFVGLDALSVISFKLMDEKGTTLISQDLGAAVDKLAVTGDGRRFAVLDDIGGENLSYYEYVPEGGEVSAAGPGEPEVVGEGGRVTAWSVIGVMYLVFAILAAVVTCILVLMSVGTKDRRVLRNSRLAAAAALVLGVGSILLGLRVGEGNVIGGGGVLFFVGAGLVLFSILYKSRAKTDLVKSRFLGIIESRGQVELKWLAKELGISDKELENLIYDAVARGQFTGYINWKSGDLYAKSAGEIETNRCPVCGATLEFAGKGVVSCEYCGTETFL
jgi:outer membrane protein assembly factor BamB